MADLQFYIENVNVPPPNNWEGLEIEVAFNNDAPDANIKTSLLEWMGPNAARLNAWFRDRNRASIFEGPRSRIEACDGVIIHQGCVDMTKKDTTFQCDIVKATLKETTRIQYIRDIAGGIHFSTLYAQGLISKADYISVPYVISSVPDYMQIALLTVSFLQMLKIIADAIDEIKALAGSIIAAAGSVPPHVGLVAWYAVLFALYVFYTIFLIILTVKILILLINNIIQPIKYKYGMRLRDLCVKACNSLGLGFSSTILDSVIGRRYVTIPKKSAYTTNATYQDSDLMAIFGDVINRKHYDDTKNPLAYGYYEGTFADLLRDISEVFNCTDQMSGQSGIVVRNGTLHIERWDFWQNQAVFTMPNQSSEAPFDDPYGTNASELAANYIVRYSQDPLDDNTYDEYDGTSCMVSFTPAVMADPKNNLLNNLVEKVLPFALARRKTELTAPEKVVNSILKFLTPFMNILLKLIGSQTKLPPLLTNTRIGVMLLSSDFTGMPKLLSVDSSSKVSVNNKRSDHLGYSEANYLMANYHSASLLLNIFQGGHNQYLTFRDKEVPLCCSDFGNLRYNNIIKSYDQKPARLDSMRWNAHVESAKVDFRVKEQYAFNINYDIIIDGV